MTTTRRLRISNLYGHGFGGAERARLEALGFRLRPETYRFPGSQLLSFLDFARGPALELIEIEDERQYIDFVPPGMEPYSPGISLVACGGSTVTPADLQREFADLEPYAHHMAYDGSDDPAAPGWTYVNFARPVVPGTFTYCTAFDEPRPARTYPTTHPNGVAGAFPPQSSRPRGSRHRRTGACGGDGRDLVQVRACRAHPDDAAFLGSHHPFRDDQPQRAVTAQSWCRGSS